MPSLFNKENSQEFIRRINQLSPQTQRLWGKMSVDQMLAHCQAPLHIAHGSLKPKINPIVKFLFAKGAKKQLLSNEPFKKNLPTFGEALVADQRVFDAEKQKLISMIEDFQKKGPDAIIKDPHPFFGELTVSQWDHMQVKHLDHHLRQFGV